MGSPTFEKSTDEVLKAYFKDTISPKLVDVVATIKATDDASQFPQNVANRFATGFGADNLKSHYDPVTNAIILIHRPL